MIECNINAVSKSYASHSVFENISFDIKSNERVGLVGPNGCGKTTLLKMIMGLEPYQSGTISLRKGSKVGYLDQIPTYEDDVLVIDVIEQAFTDLYQRKKELKKLTDSFVYLEGTELEKAMNRYSILEQEYDVLGGYLVETNINKVCTGLAIDDSLKQLPFHLCSGGEKSRVVLAKILLEKPTILMLDEPSNHLDLDSIEWLEGYLKDYTGAILIVSHDRYFLDNVCNKIIEITSTKAHVYLGNYSYYVIEKERRFLLELKVYLAQERKIKRMEDQIERYRIWGRMRDSEKMFKRAKELERRLEKVERLDKPIKDAKKMRFSNTKRERSGKRVLELMSLSKSFDDKELFQDASLEVIFGDRVAILGKNGSGKSTLIKLALGEIESDSGEIKYGSKINLGYLPQEVIFEDEHQSVLDYFMNTHSVSQNEARNQLAKALFFRDDVYKMIRSLSGGEKSKLTLVSLTYQQANFLILDEPTNHLDIDSREVLEEMLLEFEGTILFVSHDRYFIKKLATKVTEIKDKTLVYYDGSYEYYKWVNAKVDTTDKTVKNKVAKPKKGIKKDVDLKEELAKIEQSLEELEGQMNEYAYDQEKLLDLHNQKTVLESQYEEIFNQLLEEE